MEIIKTKERRPRCGANVFVRYTLHYQDFWTRGYLEGGIWRVMLWDKYAICTLESIEEWMEIPNIEA